MATILVVDDQIETAGHLRTILGLVGYEVAIAGDGIEALSVLEAQSVDLILADIAMPRLNGYQLLEHIRVHPSWRSIPFIFLSARALDSDIRFGKSLGVDDYLTKPVVIEDLLAVIQGKLRKTVAVAALPQGPRAMPAGLASTQPLCVGTLQIDGARHEITLAGKHVRLSAREFLLLEHLARRAGAVVPLTELIEVTHQLKVDVDEAGSLLRPLVRSIRRKLGFEAGDMGCIEALRGVGYRLLPPSGD